jgi:hypothetical protein
MKKVKLLIVVLVALFLAGCQDTEVRSIAAGY